MRSLALLVLLAAVSSGAIASAQHPSRSDRDRARAEFESGMRSYEARDYASALSSFEAAYALTHHPDLLHNLAVCHEHLGHLDEAIDHLERYLREAPSGSDRADDEARLRRLREQRQRERLAPLDDVPATSSPQPPPSPDETPIFLGGSLIGTGAALAIVGALLVGAAVADVGSVEGAPPGTPWSDVAAAYDRSEPLSIAGFALLGAGVAAAAVGVVMLLLPRGSAAAQSSLRIDPANARLEARF